MPLFKRRKKEEVIDTRTDLEKKFEKTGQQVGKKTGEFVQKSVDKLNGVKQSLEDNGTMDKMRAVGEKVDQTIDKVVETVSTQASKVVGKKDNQAKDKTVDADFYE